MHVAVLTHRPCSGKVPDYMARLRIPLQISVCIDAKLHNMLANENLNFPVRSGFCARVCGQRVDFGIETRT